MKHRLFMLALTALLFIEPAQAQVFGRQPVSTPKLPTAPAPVNTPAAPIVQAPTAEAPAKEENTLPENPPAEMTAEELVKVQMPLIKQINSTVTNGAPEDNKRLVQSLNALQSIKARQANRNAEPGQEVIVEDIKVNVQNPKEFETYLQKTFVAPMDVTVPETTE